MPAYYFDTSAMAKRYVVEVGSAWVQAIVTQQNGQTIYTSVLMQPELVSALQRRVREGLLETPKAERLAQQVIEHMPHPLLHVVDAQIYWRRIYEMDI